MLSQWVHIETDLKQRIDKRRYRAGLDKYNQHADETQYSNIPSFSPRRRLNTLYEPEAIIPCGFPIKWPQKAL
jgi:hypothetical protein